MLIRAWLCSRLCSWAGEIWLTPVAARSTQTSGLLAQMCARSGWRQGTVTAPPPPNLALTTTTPLYRNFALDHLPEAESPLIAHREVPGDTHSEWDHCILFLFWRLFDVAEDAKLHLRHQWEGKSRLFSPPPPKKKKKDFQRLSDIKNTRVGSLSHKALLYLSVLISLV